MDSFATIVSILYQFATNGAFLLLSALGLIVILGMMNIINLAHGELMMMGAYTASIAWHRGVPFWLCAILAFLVVGLFGACSSGQSSDASTGGNSARSSSPGGSA